MTTMSVIDPSLTVYRRLQDMYPDTLKCPCLNITVPYFTFISVSVTLHQVCSSNFTSDSWIKQLKLALQEDDWTGMSASHFQLLSNLCETIRSTIHDATNRLYKRSFVTLNVPTENSFNTELNATLDQFLTTLVINFNLLVNASRLWTQIDQPYAVWQYSSVRPDVTDAYSVPPNESNARQPPQVCCHWKKKAFPFLSAVRSIRDRKFVKRIA